MGKLGLLGFGLALAGCVGPGNSNASATQVHRTRSIPCAGIAVDSRGWTSPWYSAPFAFDELLPSWNVSREASAPFRVEVQVRQAAQHSPTPWLDLGGWGNWAEDRRASTESATARVEVDLLKLTQPQTAVRVRVATDGVVSLRSFHLCFSRTVNLAATSTADERRQTPALSVPQRRQTSEAQDLAPRICSPTAVSMVLAQQGAVHPTRKVAELLYDPQNDIYGNWNRAIQGAFELGVHGHLARFNGWSEVADQLLEGTPLILSIGVQEGQLTGAPYAATSGHLIVLVGLDGAGGALILDPAVPPSETGPRTYAMSELDSVWLKRGGFSYVLGSPEPVPTLKTED
ncbi:MAG: hypothetical protein ACI9F9_000019 [Candidatus Paceibacteria bacterium]|jgi:hypothetical protein